ncbi:uncharacterized protein LOC115320779 isoform X2 [Ixodes scapularis]|uniref:uncharacterized protein LOC115320779 isoform X2 n=1 Tax=Ixodes scapularis TaxID=6945 RepID=UPI001A9FA517|nr:uncharacterized protein LOC115320779 isoform X2 [Ixodes scapularis]
MADGRPQADLDKEFRELKGFWWLEGCYLRSSHGVLDMAECDHCNCIPKEVYYLRCYKHQLCLECKQYCEGYDCLKCGVSTSPEQLKAAPPFTNFVAIQLPGLCPICEEEMTLGVIEYHIGARHKHDVSVLQPNIQKTKNEDTTMDVDETVDGKTWAHDFEQFSEESRLSSEHLPVFEAAAESNLTSRCSPPIAQVSKRPLCKNNALESKLKEHKYECPKIERECFDCGVKVLNENLQDNLDKECQKRVVLCDACHSLVTSTQFGKHKSECPKIERKCSDCGANVLNEKIQNHQEEECQKRIVFCDACKSAMSYDELSDHDQECLEKPVFCDDCEGEILRKEKFKHAFECPMRLVYCESCEGVYAYSLEKEHRKQCEKKKLACEYCELELKGDDEKNAHLETCEEALIGCAFKEFGCNEKAPRKEMLEHEKDPHNGFLNQVILGLQERIENLERPLTALVKKLRNPDSVGSSQ